MTARALLEAGELLPCPFCGKRPTSKWYGVMAGGMNDDGYWGIDCCHAHVHADSESEAAAIWSRRIASSLAEQPAKGEGWQGLVFDEAMVDRAMAAFSNVPVAYGNDADRQIMRAALTAALAHQPQEPQS